jgi:leader peptidase (prepilin peptidase) / N-methyltransferase
MSSQVSETGVKRPPKPKVADPINALALPLVLVASTTVSIAVAPGWLGLAGAGLALVMLTIAVVDYRTFRIPNWLNLIGFILASIHAAALMPDAPLAALASASLRGTALAIVFLSLWLIYKCIRGREGMGLGDVKLAFVAGAWLDWAFIPVAVQLAAFAALTAYLFQYRFLGRSLSLTSRLPFGTFFAPAIWFAWICEQILQPF